jgi:hypothetical protein
LNTRGEFLSALVNLDPSLLEIKGEEERGSLERTEEKEKS